MELGRLFFRVVEGDDGTWVCRRGREEIDRHLDKDLALGHTAEMASEHRPSQIFLHQRDGRIFSIATLD